MPPPIVTKGTSTTGMPAAATMVSVHQSDARSSWLRSPRPPGAPPPGAPPPGAPAPAGLLAAPPAPGCWTGLRAAIVGASFGWSAGPSVAISPPSASSLSGITRHRGRRTTVTIQIVVREGQSGKAQGGQKGTTLYSRAQPSEPGLTCTIGIQPADASGIGGCPG